MTNSQASATPTVMKTEPVKVDSMALTLGKQGDKDAATKYQHYQSSRGAVQLITHKGKKIIFVGFNFCTDDEDIIEYLDDEITKGLRDVKKGKLLTHEEADPMAQMRKQMKEEARKELMAEAAAAAGGEERDMGESAKQPLNPVSSKGIAADSLKVKLPS